MNKIQVILISGGSSSGKSEFAKWFKHAVRISLDDFYKPLSQIPKDESGNYDFDNPQGVDIVRCADAIKTLKETGKTQIPVYDMITNSPVGEKTVRLISSTRFIVVEGIFSFYKPLRNLGNFKIFLDTITEVRVARRMIRDVKRKKRTSEETLTSFIVAEKNYRKYVLPTKKYADLIIPFSYNPVQLK